ncbi:hypothetical protein EC973_005934 [Apophysomyces ossiformis]|uniref:MADS-box domain-containing protein n=1 Tax=Apophysomyces ossiformis TaxID=679940 RepID=A0A8H7BRL5_9FUNG|nr:hypothetical protein EC973_005934 [Apophysomyces ossiformis]
MDHYMPAMATPFQTQDKEIVAYNSFADDDTDGESKPERRTGRRKINIEFIQDKTKRHITFSKRKAGIMKKAYELSTLTGTQVLLLVVSETGLVYTFTTPKLQPIVTEAKGKNLIQLCLNAPDADEEDKSNHQTPQGGTSQAEPSVAQSSTYVRNMPYANTYNDRNNEEQEKQEDIESKSNFWTHRAPQSHIPAPLSYPSYSSAVPPNVSGTYYASQNSSSQAHYPQPNNNVYLPVHQQKR